jgi:hypothetical protein
MKRPIVRAAGSHKHIHVFLMPSVLEVSNYSHSMTINGDTSLDYLKRKYMPNLKCYLFMDKASSHYKSKKVLKF